MMWTDNFNPGTCNAFDLLNFNLLSFKRGIIHNPLSLLTCKLITYIKWSSEDNNFSPVIMTKEHGGSGFNSFKIAVGNKVRDGEENTSGK